MNSWDYAAMNWARKEESWANIARHNVARMTTAQIAKLPKANILGPTPLDSFKVMPPNVIFLARNEHGLFLINSEGYDYARYAVKILEVKS